MNSADVRDELVRSLRLDLVGPSSSDVYQDEVLPQPPSRWYLAGFLVPYEAPPEQRTDATATETLGLGGGDGGAGGTDDDQAPEPASARRAFLPSSIGISVLTPSETETLAVTVTWGDYAPVSVPRMEEVVDPVDGAARAVWQRTARAEDVTIAVGRSQVKPKSYLVPDSDGLELRVSVRPVKTPEGDGPRLAPRGSRAVSVFLVNRRAPREDRQKDQTMVFQAALRVRSDRAFVPRPNLRGHSTGDWDEQVADLQYRDSFEWAVGHGVATSATVGPDDVCREVSTTWVPTAEVERVEPSSVPDAELGMEELAKAESVDALVPKLSPLVNRYRDWIAAQREKAPKEGPRADVARSLMDEAQVACERIAAGLESLRDPLVFESFRLANRAMAASGRQRMAQIQAAAGQKTSEVEAPRWRPFQLSFVLMNLRGIAEPANEDRGAVDLLFFPTGGGKTEAYLGLAAFTLVLRRLRNPGVASAGVSVLMRYTLRLLTLDQLSRGATLVCSLELERLKDPERLGPWPFEIGLWVGRAATPNRMGKKGDPDRESARVRTLAFQNDSTKSSPIPLENCPWCGEKFKTTSFSLRPNSDRPTDLRVVCANRRCAFTGDRALPIVSVDEPIYRRLPGFLIATVDKFASLPFVGPSGLLLGGADHHEPNAGFFGPCDPGRGTRLAAPLLPPDLIIQDELHLISGPLGTMAGLYETAIDALASREVNGRTIRPKVVASTATVRRATAQIQALFGRPTVSVFPPPGPDRRDSFFARTVSRDERAPRLYVGLFAQGRSPKVLMLRSYLALLGGAQRLWEAAGGKKAAENPADPYMTLVGYFNALRELGGARRIAEDEVFSRVKAYQERRRVGEARGLFSDRKTKYEVVELTSRESTAKVAEAKRKLGLSFADEDAVDVALATNMISVGLDISRLGLMVVMGQPKTTAEYIQATSRVGRLAEKPGLVLTLLNIHRPRDRSHVERFEAYHASFYRAVEATSVTPFSPRAIDRGLAAVVVSLARHGVASLTAPASAIAVARDVAPLVFVGETLARRAEGHSKDVPREAAQQLARKVRRQVKDLVDAWASLAHDNASNGAGLQYAPGEVAGPHLLWDPLDPGLDLMPPVARKFRAQRSLRDVEPSVPIWVKRPDGMDVPEDPE